MTRAEPGLGRIILTHILVGPPVGTLVFIATMVTIGVLQGKGSAPETLQSFLGVMPMAIAAGYILGAIPAMITSLGVAWIVRRTQSTWGRFLGAAAVGAVFSCIGLFWAILSPTTGNDGLLLAFGIGLTGAAAALASLAVVIVMTPRVEPA